MEIRVGERIRDLRKKAGLTQEQLAETLGVTAGAVYKWESGRAMPELEMLVELGRFFEVSVDALLDYGWETMSMGRAVEQLSGYIVRKELEEGMRYAEKALQKYPNSFQVVLKSAEIYFLTMEPKHGARAIELYRRALQLIDQNTDPAVGPVTIQNRIAACCSRMDRMEEAVELLKKNNVGGINNGAIGLYLSQEEGRAEEALPYLSDALLDCCGQLYNICMGYANAYDALGKQAEAVGMLRWFLKLESGLRDGTGVNWMDKIDVGLLLILAKMELTMGNTPNARAWLRQARETARRFDAAPEYRASAGLNYYHRSKPAAAYDDMGQTAAGVIERFLADDAGGGALRPLWKELQSEYTHKEGSL